MIKEIQRAMNSRKIALDAIALTIGTIAEDARNDVDPTKSIENISKLSEAFATIYYGK